MTKQTSHAKQYLDKHFPKGNVRRGEAMVLLALAEGQGYAKALDDVKQKLNDLRGYCQSISSCDNCRKIAIEIQKYAYEIAKLKEKKA